MPVEVLFALGAATCFASGSIAVKRATQQGNVTLGFLTGLVTTAVVLGVLALLTVERWQAPLGVVLLFAFAGVAGTGIGRVLTMVSVRDIGASVAVPVQSSTNPLIASTAGILLLDEVTGLDRLFALGLILVGIWACVRGGSANRPPLLEGPGTARRRPGPWVLLLPMAAGAAFAGADILRKVALGQGGEPVLGAFIGTVTALAIWLVIIGASPRLRQAPRSTSSLAWFVLYGLLTAGAQVCSLFALRHGDLSLVSPIVASQPVIVVIVGALVLRDLEKVRTGAVLGSLGVFLGVAYLASTR